jgi:hypothetical protein
MSVSITSTSKFQVKKDIYDTREERDKNKYIKINTNNRYTHFNQTHFTAGDEEQFEQYKNSTTIKKYQNKILLYNNIFNMYTNILNTDINKYKDFSHEDVMNTFRYIFHKFKKGIYVKIENNKLKVFLPFSKNKFVNEWSDKIKIPDNNIHNFLSKISSRENRKFNIKNINKNINTWYSNDSLIRYEYPVSENDTNHSVFKNLLEELCDTLVIPDVEFFLNRRDFPILKKTRTEPYDNMWDDDNYPLVSHDYDKFCPILSMSKTDSYADILIPTWEEWLRVKSFEDKWFNETYSKYPLNFNNNWHTKKPIAVFRGSSTGIGVTIETNPRLKIAYLSSKKLKDGDDDELFLDAGITKWQLRPRKIKKIKELQTMMIENFPFSLVPKLSPEEQSNYKYIIHIEGHVSAFRLSLELNMNSVILMVESKWQLWYSNLLKPYIHYIPVKSDLSDIYDKIKWCKNNDDKCIEIIKNCKNFYDTFLSKKSVLNYFQKVFIEINKISLNKKINIMSPLEIQEILQYENIKNSKENNNTINFLKTKLLFENKLSSIYNFGNIILKTTNDPKKIKENINETFVYINLLNNIKKPYFLNCLNFKKNNNYYDIYLNYVQGIILNDFLKNSYFDIKNFLLILVQVVLIIQELQNNFNMVHNDLTPWNIILINNKNKEKLSWFFNNKIFTIEPEFIPVIIDFGKSSYIYNETLYGIINNYNFSSIHDIIVLLLQTVKTLMIDDNNIKNNISIKLMNFISNTKYTNNITNFNKENIEKILLEKGNYDDISNNKKEGLEHLTPLDFIDYLFKNFTILKEVIKIEEYEVNKDIVKIIIDEIMIEDIVNIKNNIKEPYERYYNEYIYYDSEKINNILSNVSYIKKYKDTIYCIINNYLIGNKVINSHYIESFIIKNLNYLRWIFSLDNTLKIMNKRINIINNIYSNNKIKK